MGHVLVIGSINADLVVAVGQRPLAGETVRGGPLQVLPGGKGANQAVAARRLGAETSLVGAVGTDPNAPAALRELKASGVDLSRVRVHDGTTGTAVIVVTPDGENQIIVSEGANGRVTGEEVEAAVHGCAPRTVVLLQLELPLEIVRHAVAAAQRRGLRVVLNAAPVAPLDATVLQACDPLVVNETEAAALLPRAETSGAEETVEALLALGAPSVVLTIGGAGCVWSAGDGIRRTPAPRVDVVDTTGAGDAFAGALCAALSDGAHLEEAVALGVRVGAWAVQAVGTQSAYARTADLERFGADA